MSLSATLVDVVNYILLLHISNSIYVHALGAGVHSSLLE